MYLQQAQWELLHTNRTYFRSLPEPLALRWQRCYEKGISPNTDSFRVYSPQKYQAIKSESVQAYAYSNRFFSLLEGYSETPCLGFAIFDRNGCLLKLYGQESFHTWCERKGIAPRTDWSEESIGTNAVSLGLELKKDVAVVGEENFCHMLIDAAVYFSPYLIGDKHQRDETVVFGGVAVIVPHESRSRDYLMLAAAAANDVALHLFMTHTLYDLYNKETKGMLTIDINLETGKTYTLYHNETLFHVFGMEYENLYFKPVETIFDPLPKNEEFWSIIEEGRDVPDQNMTLSVKGVESVYIVATEAYYQKHLSIRGVRFFITSAKDISSNVSKKIGNNALMTFDDILGDDPRFVDCLRLAKAIAKNDSNVLILGESGVGKDIIAQAIHNASDRRGKPFIVVNCATLPRDLIASELFGYEGGAFTSSKKNGNIGKFELANSGTVFLDEIGDMPLDLQVTLLRVIEQKSFMRLGSNVVTNIDVKVIAATNANINQLIEQKKFRADLYYRFTLRLVIPSLRERRNDVVLLAEHFIRSVSARINKPNLMTLSVEAKLLLRHFPWAGNVRELQNLIEGIVQLYSVDVIEPEIIRAYLGISEVAEPQSPTAWEPPPIELPAEEHFKPDGRKLTRPALEYALLRNHYNKTNTAEYLGISRKTLYRQMKKFGFDD
jgi:Transcriptional regulator containing PAS, AAA-type ATPase, and DNA-binding domains